jgi:hypothetical protein
MMEAQCFHDANRFSPTPGRYGAKLEFSCFASWPGDETQETFFGIGSPAERAIQAAGEFAREKNVAEPRATIGFHGSKALRRLQIAEIQPGP